MKGKKGNLEWLKAGVIAFMVVVIVVVVSAKILGSFRAGEVADSVGYNIGTQGLNGVKTIGDNLGTIAIVIVAVAIIALVGMLGYGRNK